jgi:hypothetical protein
MDKQKTANKENGFTESRKGNKFKFESPVPGLHIYSNIWPESMDFMRELETDKFWEEHPLIGKPWIREDYFDEENGKKASTCWLWNHQKAADALTEVIDSYLWHWDLDPQSREALRITKYTAGEFFSAHPDDSYGTPRTVSMVYYPNDDYEGGELEFLHFGVKIKPKAGQLFLFPSAYSYEHRIHPVTSGNERYTIVSFFNHISEKEKSDRLKTIAFPYQANLQYMFDKDFSVPKD